MKLRNFTILSILCILAANAYAERSLSADLQMLETSPTYKAMICAHRGNCYAAYQNNLPQSSLATLEATIAAGIDMFEVDGRQTKDGQLVNMHDASIDAFTTGKGKVADLTLAEIQQYYLINRDGTASNERVHTVREMFEAARDRIYVVVDMKEGSIGVAMADVAAELGMIDQVLWYFPNSEKEGANAIFKKYPRAVLMPYSSTAQFLTTLHGRYDPLYIFSTSLESINSDAQLRSTFEGYDMVAYANHLDHDKELAAGNNSYLNNMINANIRFIQSDYGDLILKQLNDSGMHYEAEKPVVEERPAYLVTADWDLIGDSTTTCVEYAHQDSLANGLPLINNNVALYYKGERAFEPKAGEGAYWHNSIETKGDNYLKLLVPYAAKANITLRVRPGKTSYLHNFYAFVADAELSAPLRMYADTANANAKVNGIVISTYTEGSITLQVDLSQTTKTQAIYIIFNALEEAGVKSTGCRLRGISYQETWYEGMPAGVENAENGNQGTIRKFVKDGNIYIQKNNHTYNISGSLIQ